MFSVQFMILLSNLFSFLTHLSVLFKQVFLEPSLLKELIFLFEFFMLLFQQDQLFLHIPDHLFLLVHAFPSLFHFFYTFININYPTISYKHYLCFILNLCSCSSYNFSNVCSYFSLFSYINTCRS